MKPASSFIFLLCLIVSAAIAETGRSGMDRRMKNEALDELHRRSDLPKVDLDRLLGDCDANQQSMYFCAWRDQIAADLALRHIVEDKERTRPSCRPSIDSGIASWTRSRDRACSESATKQWGEGSMRQTARLTCIAAETTRMSRRLERLQGCNVR
jgi:hypothetical protein